RLSQGNVVALQQALGGGVLELYQPLLALQVSEETMIHDFRRQTKSACDFLENRLPVEGGPRHRCGDQFASLLCAKVEMLPVSCRRVEDQLAQLLRRMAGHHFKLTTVL